MNAAELEKHLRRLLGKGPERFIPLPPSPVRPAVPGGIARGTPGGSGQSAFIEDDYDDREYYPAQTVRTSDGLFAIEIEPIKSILLTSGDRAQFKSP